MPNWNDFPYDNSDFDYAEQALADNWTALHGGDQVAYPDSDWVGQLAEHSPHALPSDFDGNLDALAEQLQQAWRSFHRGDFGQAWEQAMSCGMAGHVPANKAMGIYATYLEEDETQQSTLFQQIVAHAKQAISLLPDDANSHYFHAFALGRYSQSISVVKALKQGLGGKIHESLTQCLALAPEHAEAHTAMGLYHAEIIDKVGKLIGGMTYGANVDTAMEHFQAALELNPESPIAHIEYGNGIYLMFGDKRLDEVTDYYVKATELAARDAMEKLDIQSAVEELE